MMDNEHLQRLIVLIRPPVFTWSKVADRDVKKVDENVDKITLVARASLLSDSLK